jgi:LmbE family N-acetylglucosaminyl deacetylase
MEFLNRSILVVAHPDDENLWFSSILSKVGEIVLCFLPVATNPVWTEGRRKSLSEHLLSNIHCLELDEAGVFWGVNWDRAVNTEYGLKITEGYISDELYIRNYEKLKTMLREHLQHYENVFTHNPWGEYGHPEHVQVYRAVKALQDELKFTLWFSNYASNKSADLMIRALSDKSTCSMTLKTDKVLAQRIANIYKRNACWTWYDDYEWCDNEAFIKDTEASTVSRKYGALLPINLLAIQPQNAGQSPNFLRELIVRVMRTIKRIYLRLLK